MDNFEYLDPNEIKSEVNQNIPISPEIPASPPNLSTAPPMPNPMENINRPPNIINSTPSVAQNKPQSILNDSLLKNEKKITGPKPAKVRTKNLIIGIAVGLALLAIIGVGVYYFVFLKKSASVNITASQTSVSLNIDGVDYPNVTSPYLIKLSKGSHQVTAGKEGFASMAKTLNIISTTQTYTVSFDLLPYPSATKILTKAVLFPAYGKDLKSLFYFDKLDNGEYALKEFDLAAQKEVTQIDTMGEVTKVAWSPTYRQLAIKVINSTKDKEATLPYLSQYPEGTKVNWIVNLERTDLINTTKKDLHPSVKNITFNPNGDKIAYLFQNETTRVLGVANYDGSNFDKLMEFKTIEFEPDVVWSPDGNRIAIFSNQETDAASQAKNPNVYTYNFDARNVIQVSNDGVSYGALFSPDGSKLAYISGNNVMIYDFSKGASASTGLAASLANCSWLDNQTILIATNDKSIFKLGLNANPITKDEVGYQKDSVGVIQNIFSDGNTLYLFANDGVYQLSIEGNI